MAETVIQRLPGHLGECEFAVLTTYPSADEGRLPHGAAARLVGLEPWRLAVIEFPVALLARIARLLRLPLGWVRTRGCRAMLAADVVVDVAGISFAPGRGIPILVYNALMTGTPLLLGVPTVKAAQAMGPFDSQPNSILARLVLPRLSAICARGARTRAHLDVLGLSNVVDVADLAFSLDEATDLPADIARQVAGAGDGYVVVMPSSVVRQIVARDGDALHRQAGAVGDPYVDAMARLIAEIRSSTGAGVIVAPHSYRTGQPEGRMNDGPVCREVAEACGADPGVVGIDADLTAGELRRLVSGGSVLVTSRFHAMISGLATGVPTVVVGWSHKYREVLADFGMERFGMDSTALSDPVAVAKVVVEARANRDAISREIRSALPEVIERSAGNFRVIARVATEARVARGEGS